VSLMEGIKPAGATHKWYWSNGSFRAWLKVAEWVYSYDAVHGWTAIAKHPSSLHGEVEPL
jgi:hypothetical protein